ncbi:MAG: hypothetical protein PHU65_08440, partial [Actinomycetota bacterium]|nr:hypothetical protein [Actinomycetota bacterium]
MNMFNRIIVSILMLCIVVFCIVAIVNTFANLFEWSDVSDRIIDSAHNLNRFVLGAILFLIFAIALIIFIFEIYRKRAKTANIAADSSGKSMLTIRTTEEQIKTSLGRINDVKAPQVKIIPKPEGIVINIFSKLVSGVNVADKTREIREKALEIASQKLSLKVIQTNYTATGFVPKDVAREPVKEEKKIEEDK